MVLLNKQNQNNPFNSSLNEDFQSSTICCMRSMLGPQGPGEQREAAARSVFISTEHLTHRNYLFI